MARKQWRNGWDETRRSFSQTRFLESLRKLVPELESSDIEPAGSGVRAQAVGRDGRLVDDFFIQTGPGMVHVLNAPSPAATASIAIGKEIADRILGEDTKSVSRRIGASSRTLVAV
jgi:L-2-hydroxyglutarate oxidase